MIITALSGAFEIDRMAAVLIMEKEKKEKNNV